MTVWSWLGLRTSHKVVEELMDEPGVEMSLLVLEMSQLRRFRLELKMP